MKKELPQGVVWAVLAVIVIAVVVIGYKVLGPKSFNADTSGSEKLQEKVKSGQPMYTPPPGVPGITAPQVNK